jgi:voltage-gated potassium channel
MNDTRQRPGPGPGDDGVDDPGGRLATYQARTDTPLDLLALATVWLVVVPPSYFGRDGDHIALAARIILSVLYGIDLAIRGVLAGRPVRYALAHPAALASVLYPPVRVIFSFRLVRSIFRRGNLLRFLLGASVLLLNSAVIVYLVERHAPGSNIHTLGESLWWSLVTITTVGYGDYTPVTIYGRITACCIMGIGLVTLAVITAQVASNFVSQAASEDQGGPQAAEATPGVTLAELDRRLARIEELLIAAAPSSQQAPEGESGSQ